MSLYRDIIIELYKNPLNRREIPNANATASGANVTCGDRVRMYAKFATDGKIAECSFMGEGCAISVASASLLTEEAKGKNPHEISEWGTLEIFDWLGEELGPSRVKCGLLALETLQEALKKTVILSLSKNDGIKALTGSA